MCLTKNLYDMKLKAIIYLIALTLPAAVSCKKEAEGNSASNAKVDFTAEAGVFKGGEMVTMLSEGLQADMDAVQFKVSDDGAFVQENGGEFRFNGTKGASFRAWLPSDAKRADGKIEFSAAADQSTGAGLVASDFMTACADIAKATAQPVKLAFSHRMAKMRVVLNGFDAASVRLRGARLPIVWEYSTNKLFSKDNAEAVPVMMNRQEEGVFLAMLPAQALDVTASEENPFITVTTEGGRTFTWNPESALRLSEGKALVVTLTKAITGTELVAVSLEMEAAWGDEYTDATASLEEIVGEERKLDGKALGFTVESEIPNNPWAGNLASLFDGNYASYWYSNWITAQGCVSDENTTRVLLPKPYDISHINCNGKDHVYEDFTFENFFSLNATGGSPKAAVYLPWTVIVDMKSVYNVTKVATTVCDDFINAKKAGHRSLFQRIKDYAYYVSNDKVNWTLVAEGTMPVYGESTFTVTADQKRRHAGRYLKFEIKTMHWREKMAEGASEDDYHAAKKCSATTIGPVILGEIEVWCK